MANSWPSFRLKCSAWTFSIAPLRYPGPMTKWFQIVLGIGLQAIFSFSGGQVVREGGQVAGQEAEEERDLGWAGEGHHHPGPEDALHHHRQVSRRPPSGKNQLLLLLMMGIGVKSTYSSQSSFTSWNLFAIKRPTLLHFALLTHCQNVVVRGLTNDETRNFNLWNFSFYFVWPSDCFY